MGQFAVIASLVISAGSAVEQSNQASKAAAAAKEGRAISGAEERVSLATRKRREIRERRVREATIKASSQATGVAGSSGEGGALAILGTNVAANTAQISRQVSTAGSLTVAAQQQADASLRGQIAGSVGSIAGSVFQTALSNPETNKQFRSLFTQDK